MFKGKWLSVFEMGWHEELCAYVYKGVEVKMVNGNAKSFFVCVWERKSQEHWTKWNK